MFTEKGYTATHKEMDESLTRDLYEQIVVGVAGGRRKTEADVRAHIDQGPLLPEAPPPRSLRAVRRGCGRRSPEDRSGRTGAHRPGTASAGGRPTSRPGRRRPVRGSGKREAFRLRRAPAD